MAQTAAAGRDGMARRQAGWVWVGLLAVLGCTPAYDWREVRPEGAALVAMFPCRPQHHARTADLAGMSVPMQLHVCTGGKETLAVGVAQVAHPHQVAAALLALRAAATANFAATQVQTLPVQVPGMTPNANAARVSMRGVSTQGASVEAIVVVFAKGLRVYQATIFGAQVDPEVSQMFFSGLKLE